MIKTQFQKRVEMAKCIIHLRSEKNKYQLQFGDRSRLAGWSQIFKQDRNSIPCIETKKKKFEWNKSCSLSLQSLADSAINWRFESQVLYRMFTRPRESSVLKS